MNNIFIDSYANVTRVCIIHTSRLVSIINASHSALCTVIKSPLKRAWRIKIKKGRSGAQRGSRDRKRNRQKRHYLPFMSGAVERKLHLLLIRQPTIASPARPRNRFSERYRSYILCDRWEFIFETPLTDTSGTTLSVITVHYRSITSESFSCTSNVSKNVSLVRIVM